MGFLNDWIQTRRERTAAIKSATDVLGGMQLPFSVTIPGAQGSAALDKKKAVEQYRNWVYSAANKNARAIASARLRLFSARATGQAKSRAKSAPVSQARFAELKATMQIPAVAGAVEVEEVLVHLALDLLDRVNNYSNRFDTFELLSLFLDLTGNTFWFIEDNALGLPETIWTLPSQWVKVIPGGKNEFIKGFLFGRNATRQRTFRPDEVIWFLLPNPADPFSGKSRVSAAWDGITGYDARGTYETQLLQNNAIPATMINYSKGTLLPAQRRDLQAAFNNVIRAVARHGKSFVADENIDIKTISVPPRDIAMLRAREWRRDEIITAFGQTLSLYDPKANRANIEGAIFLWQNDEITPSLKRIEQKLNEQLIPRYGEPRLFFAFDPIVQRDKTQELADDTVWLAHGMPLNQILRRRGMQEVEGGDIGYISSALLPLGSAPQLSDNADSKQMLLSKARLLDDVSLRGTLKADLPPIDRELTGGVNPALTSTEKTIADGVRKVFGSQKPLAVAEAAKEVGADFAWVAGESWAEEIVKLSKGAMAVEIQVGAGKGADKIGVALADFIDQPAVQMAAEAESYQFARAVGKGSAKELQTAMSAGLEAGDSIPELQNRIKGIFAGWENWRVERVARSESARALTTGEEMVWKESGVVSGKAWDAAGDSCPFCREMHGEIIQLGESYWTVDGPNQTVEFQGKTITLAHEYLDVAGPPLHPNCVTAETTVFAPHKVAGLVASYRGPVIEITLADGRRLTVTPNHMLLTPNGFVQAQFLTNADNVLCCSDFEGIIPGNPNDNGNPARVDNVIKTLSEASCSDTVSMPSTAKYLHGDAANVHGDIDVVWANGLLGSGLDMQGIKHPKQKSFNPGWFRDSLNGTSVLAKTLERAGRAADSSMGRHRELLSRFGRGVCHPQEHGLASVSLGDTVGVKPVRDDAAAAPKRLSEFLDGCSGLIVPQQIVDIQVDSINSHVYDLHCLTTMYIANGVLSSNCRCDLLPILIEGE